MNKLRLNIDVSWIKPPLLVMRHGVSGQCGETVSKSQAGCCYSILYAGSPPGYGDIMGCNYQHGRDGSKTSKTIQNRLDFD